MSITTEASVDAVIEAIATNLRASDGQSVYLTGLGKKEIRSALNQLIWEIKEEIRNEAHQ